MKIYRIFISMVLMIIIGGSVSYSCDMCNCYLGISPSDNMNVVGLRYKYAQQSHKFAQHTMRLQHDMDHMSQPASGDWDGIYNELELYAQYIPNPNFRVMAFLPFKMNTFSYNGNTIHENALGDLTLLAHYQLLNTMNYDSSTVRHRVFAGGGIKFPTGSWKMDDSWDIPFSHFIMAGTGSTDLLASVQYMGAIGSFGWMADVSYKIKFENPDEYRFGNTLNVNASGYYSVAGKNNLWIPYVRSSVESGAHDRMKEMTVENSGGQIWWGGAGLEYNFSSFRIDFNLMMPLSENLNGEQPGNDFRGLTSLSYTF